MAPDTAQSASVGSYNPKSSGLITWHNAIPRFLDKGDTPRAYLERCIETIDVREPTVKAFVSMDLEVARKAADKATPRYKNNQPLSVVDGMPFVVKDLYEVKGMATERVRCAKEERQSSGRQLLQNLVREMPGLHETLSTLNERRAGHRVAPLPPLVPVWSQLVAAVRCGALFSDPQAIAAILL